MSLFGLEKVEGVVEDKDTLGGFQAIPSDVYPITIDVMYVKVAKSGAKAISLHGKKEDGSDYAEDFYFTAGEAKGGKHYTENNGTKRYLPGFNMMNAATSILMGKSILALEADDVETKVVKQRNPETKKDEPVEVQALVGVKGKVLKLGIQRVVQNANKQVDGKWVTTNDKRTQNQTDRIFNEDGLTFNELKAEETEPNFINDWLEKWQGKDNDRFKEVKGAAASGTSAGGDKSGGSGKSLFGKK